MARPFRRRMILALIAIGSVLILVAPQAFGRATPSAVRLISNPQALEPQPSAAYVLYHPLIYRNASGLDSSLEIQNTGTSVGTYVLEFYDASGVVALTQSGTLAAGAVQSIAPISGLSAGFVGSLILSSDQPMQSTVLQRTTAGMDQLLAYRGIAAAESAMNLYLGPFSRSAAGTSTVAVQNVGSASTSVTFTAVSANGGAPQSFVIAGLNPGGVAQLFGPNATSLGDNFSGYVRATATQPLVGIADYQSDTLRWARPAGVAGSQSSYVPRFYRSGGNADGPRTTRLYLINTSTGAAAATVALYNPDGLLAATQQLTIAAGAMASFDPTGIALPGGFVGSAIVSSDQPLLMTELTTYDGAPTRISDADSYSIPGPAASDTQLILPHIFFSASPNYQSAIHVQNVSSSSANIQLQLSNGTTLTRGNVAPGAAVRFDRAAIGADFDGTGVVTGDTPLNALIDIELEPQSPVTPTPTATQVPTPTPATGTGLTPIVYVNYLTGAPGSVFVVRGYNFPASSQVALSVNNELATTLTTDANGEFELLLQTPDTAQAGYYVVTAVVQAASTNTLQAHTSALASSMGVFQLVTSGAGAVVRPAPPDAPATSVELPQDAQPLDEAPYLHLPLIRR